MVHATALPGLRQTLSETLTVFVSSSNIRNSAILSLQYLERSDLMLRLDVHHRCVRTLQKRMSQYIIAGKNYGLAYQ